MARWTSVLLILVACAAPGRPRSDASVPARLALDSVQIERTCAHPAHVRVGLLECELKNQAPELPVDALDLAR